MSDYLKNIDNSVLDYKDEVKRVRRDLHQIPELGLEEFKTQSYILNYLEDLGYSPEKAGDTGVVLFIPGNIKGSTIGLRADIDALPIQEEDDKPFSSKHPGKMHACGHDGHMTMLLTLAKYLKDHDVDHRDLLLVFQPAEEGPGGADTVVKSGALDKYQVGEIYGFHLFPFVDEGVLSTTPGEMMAMTSEFYPVIKGRASHAGHPENGVDALIAACQFVLSVQTIISRNVAFEQECLINIGTLEAGEKMNIVPKEAKLSGTMRSYNLKTHELMKKRLEEILDGIDICFNTKSEINYVDMYPPVINDEELFNRLWEKANEPKELFNKVMLAEDFSLYSQKVPILFMGLGTRTDKYSSDLHTKDFDFDETVLLRGIDTYLRIISE